MGCGNTLQGDCTRLVGLRICRLNLDDVVDFFNKTVSDFPEFEDVDFRCEFAGKLANNAEFIVAFNVDDDIVAMMAAYMNRPPLSYISHFCILKPYRRIGLSGTMLSFMENCASQRGCSFLRLEVKKANMVALSAYERFGFVEDGVASEDSVYMKKEIKH